MEKLYLIEGEDLLLTSSEYWKQHCWICEIFATSIKENQKGAYLPGDIFDGEDIIGHLEQLLGREIGNQFVVDDVPPISTADSAKPPLNPLTKDEISYAFVNHILLPNKFRVVYASYQGAPSISFRLYNPQSGEKEIYEYPDVIALTPAGFNDFDALLVNSFGVDDKSAGTDEDSVCYSPNTGYFAALRASLELSGVIRRGTEFSDVLVGVAYDDNPEVVIQWDLCATDFMFRIEQCERWSFGIWRSELGNMIREIQGSLTLPLRLAE
jgi:hypothetical protein